MLCPYSVVYLPENSCKKIALPADVQREQSHAISLIYVIHIVSMLFRKERKNKIIIRHLRKLIMRYPKSL